MNVLSLYDGISCGMVALERAGIKVDNYYAAEIDKYATKISEANYPDIIRMGDVTKWREWDIDWCSIDLVMAGFPCQSWSIAGQQLGDKDERGALFWTTLDIISNVLKHNPNAKFLMENVKMKDDFEKYITHHAEKALGHVEKILINSSKLSAQHRERYYWSNFTVDHVGFDKGLLLKDVIEYPLSPAHELTPEACARFVKYSNCSKRLTIGTTKRPNKIGQRDEVYGLDRKMGTLTATMYKQPPQYLYEKDGYEQLRRLSPLECERLQTLPDGYTLVANENGKQIVSNTQRYKAIGNGWTVDVIAHILRGAF